MSGVAAFFAFATVGVAAFSLIAYSPPTPVVLFATGLGGLSLLGWPQETEGNMSDQRGALSSSINLFVHKLIATFLIPAFINKNQIVVEVHRYDISNLNTMPCSSSQ